MPNPAKAAASAVSKGIKKTYLRYVIAREALSQPKERIGFVRKVAERDARALMRHAMKARHPSVYRHTINVVRLSRAIFKRMLKDATLLPDGKRKELHGIELHEIEDAALFHDIGKLGLSKELLSKKGITEKERRRLRRHVRASKFISRGLVSRKASKGLAQHHEKFDGTGYPKGLKGEEISLVGKIVSVADHFMGITEHRSYAEPRTPNQALREIISRKGEYYDPDVVDAFVKVMSSRGIRT